MLTRFVISAGNLSNVPLNFLELSLKHSAFMGTNNTSFTDFKAKEEKEIDENICDLQEDNMSKTKNIALDKDLLIELEKNITKDIIHVNNYEDLYNLIDSYKGKIILDGSLKTVFKDGPRESEIMVIGEAPGANEDEKLLPFVGDAGLLLNKMLKYIGIDRDQVYITNVSYWRPEKNRTPNPAEIKILRPFLIRHINIKKPKIILLLGNVASNCLLDSGLNLNKLRGIVHYFTTDNGEKIPIILSFHPSFLKRFPSFIPEAKKDMDFFNGEWNGIKNTLKT